MCYTWIGLRLLHIQKFILLGNKSSSINGCLNVENVVNRLLTSLGTKSFLALISSLIDVFLYLDRRQNY